MAKGVSRRRMKLNYFQVFGESSRGVFLRLYAVPRLAKWRSAVMDLSSRI
jgi:hypothetical protein